MEWRLLEMTNGWGNTLFTPYLPLLIDTHDWVIMVIHTQIHCKARAHLIGQRCCTISSSIQLTKKKTCRNILTNSVLVEEYHRAIINESWHFHRELFYTWCHLFYLRYCYKCVQPFLWYLYYTRLRIHATSYNNSYNNSFIQLYQLLHTITTTIITVTTDHITISSSSEPEQ
jgi:hypothetical protein